MTEELASQRSPIRANGIFPSGVFGCSSGVIPGNGNPGGGSDTGMV